MNESLAELQFPSQHLRPMELNVLAHLMAGSGRLKLVALCHATCTRWQRDTHGNIRSCRHLGGAHYVGRAEETFCVIISHESLFREPVGGNLLRNCRYLSNDLVALQMFHAVI